jgi:hypothetical protein
MAPQQMGRDLRIDCLRGICLLVIYCRHLDPNSLKIFTPSVLGFSDAAEGFIFLSGLVSGRVYTNAMRNGFIFCQLKALRRCGVLYVAHIVTIFLTLALVITLFGGANFHEDGVVKFLQQPDAVVQHVFLLSHSPFLFDILPLYIFFLAPMPLMLLLSRNVGSWAMLLFSFQIYSSVQFFPEIVRPSGAWRDLHFNPFAWQFLFFVGVGLGNGYSKYSWLPKNRWMITGAVVGLIFTFLYKLFSVGLDNPRILHPSGLPWSKVDLGPLRLMHFALVVYFCWAVLPASSPIYQQRILIDVIRCGQNSLPIFCLGALLVSLANEFLWVVREGLWWQLAANVTGCAGLALFGNLLHWMKMVLETKAKTDVPPEVCKSAAPAVVVYTPDFSCPVGASPLQGETS